MLLEFITELGWELFFILCVAGFKHIKNAFMLARDKTKEYRKPKEKIKTSEPVWDNRPGSVMPVNTANNAAIMQMLNARGLGRSSAATNAHIQIQVQQQALREAQRQAQIERLKHAEQNAIYGVKVLGS